MFRRRGKSSPPLRARQGTLFFSILNLVEIAALTPGDTLNAIAGFLEHVGENWIPFNCNVWQVSKNEHDLRRGVGELHAPIDDGFLDSHIDLVRRHRIELLRRPTLSAALDLFRTSPSAREAFCRMGQDLKQLLSTIEDAQNRWRSSRENRKHAFPVNAPGKITRAAEVYHRIMRTVMNEKLDENDVVDLLHATVSLAHGDFVVLDKH